MAGESYAGRYLPVYAAHLYDYDRRLKEGGWLTPVNLSSVMIGASSRFASSIYAADSSPLLREWNAGLRPHDAYVLRDGVRGSDSATGTSSLEYNGMCKDEASSEFLSSIPLGRSN